MNRNTVLLIIIMVGSSLHSCTQDHLCGEYSHFRFGMSCQQSAATAKEDRRDRYYIAYGEYGDSLIWTPSNLDSIMLSLDTNDYVHISWGFEDEDLFLSKHVFPG
jgi:hypothetical protein